MSKEWRGCKKVKMIIQRHEFWRSEHGFGSLIASGRWISALSGRTSSQPHSPNLPKLHATSCQYPGRRQFQAPPRWFRSSHHRAIVGEARTTLWRASSWIIRLILADHFSNWQQSFTAKYWTRFLSFTLSSVTENGCDDLQHSGSSVASSVANGAPTAEHDLEIRRESYNFTPSSNHAPK